MDIEYDKGQRLTPCLWELSPLEAAILTYEQQVRKYYRARISPAPDTAEKRREREKDLDTALRHLRNERRHISTLAQIQAGLEQYQYQGRSQAGENPFLMLKEKHHPTTILARNMRADGRPRPSDRHSAHHLVPGKGKHPSTTDIRLRLHLYGIRINDPDNGTWMPKTKADKGHWSAPDSPAHSEIHTYNYEIWVSSLIHHLDSEQTIRSALIRIRSLLRDGKQPEKVTKSHCVQQSPHT